MRKNLKRFFITALSAAFAVVLAFAVAACANTAVTVTFDANGGAFADGKASVSVEGAAGDAFEVPADPARGEYDFLGWSTSREGELVEVEGKIPDANATYYAQWIPEGSVAVVFYANGGAFADGSSSKTVTGKPGESLVQPEAPTRSGYRFSMWSSTKSGTLASVPLTFPDHTISFYAAWDEVGAETYTLTLIYGINGDRVGTTTDRVEKVKAGTALADVIKVNLQTGDNAIVFAGWYRADGTKIADDATMPAENLALRARYTVSYSLTVHRQNEDGATYDDPVTTQETGFYGERYAYTAPEGFEIDARHEGSNYTADRLGKDAAFTVYVARRRYTVTFLAGEEGVNEARDVMTLWYGAKYTIPAFETTAIADMVSSELFAFSWKTSDGETVRAGESFTVKGVTTVRADLITGKTDLFGGDDRVFVDGEDAVLRRGAIVRYGSFDGTTNVFSFGNGPEDEVLGGVALTNSFYYYNDTTAKEYVDFFGSGAKLRFLYHGDAEYTPAGADVALSGSLTVAEETGRYTFTPAGEGDPVEFSLDVLYDDADVAHPAYRTESKHEQGKFARLEDKSAPDDYGYTILDFDGFGFVTEYYDPAYANSPDESEREFYEQYNGSVGRYYRYTGDLWEGAEYYSIEFSDGTGYTVELTMDDGLFNIGEHQLAGTWFAYDGLLGEGDYLVGIAIAGGRAAGFGASITATYASLIVDGFGNALVNPNATFEEDNCTYSDLKWTGTYVLRSDVIYGYGIDELGPYMSGSVVEWIEYTDSTTGKVTLYSFETDYRTYSVMASAPKRYFVAEEDLSLFGTSIIEDYFYGADLPFTEVLFFDVRGDASLFYIYGRRSDASYWTVTDGREVIPLYEPIESGTATLASGVYTFTSVSQKPNIASMRFTLVANGGTMTVDVLSGSEQAAESQTLTDEETGESFTVDEFGVAYYRASADAEPVEVGFHRDTLGEVDDEYDTGDDYSVWRSGFYRFDLPDGSTATFTYRIEDNGDLTFKRIETPEFSLLATQSYLDAPDLDVYLYVTEENDYYLGYMPDDGYTFWKCTVTPVADMGGVYTFNMPELFRETFEYYTGIAADDLRIRINDDNTFSLFTGTLSATDPVTGTTLSADGFGSLTLTEKGEASEHPYAVRSRDEGHIILVYASFEEEFENSDGLTIGKAHEHYLIIDTAKNTFVAAEAEAGVYYAVSLSSNGVSLAQMAFELDGQGNVVVSSPNVSDRTGTYEETGTLANSATMLGLLGLDYDLTLYTFTLTDEEGEESTMNVAAFHTSELTYVMDGETYLFVPIGFFFEQMPAATLDMDTEDGGFIRSNGYTSYNSIVISDAIYDDGRRIYQGIVQRGTYDDNSYYYEGREFVVDENGGGDVLYFEAYDGNSNDVIGEFFFDIVEQDGVEIARLRPMPSGLYVSLASGEISGNTLSMDGYGEGTLVSNGRTVEGTVTPAEGEDGSYIFESDDKETRFKFATFTVRLARNSQLVCIFSYANDMEDGPSVLVADDWSVLFLDEYFNSYYIDHLGNRYDGQYTFLGGKKDIASMTLNSSDAVLYFDLDFEHGSFELDTREFIVDSEDGTLLAYTGNGSISKFPDEVKRIVRGSFYEGDYISASGTMDLNQVEVIEADAFHYVNLGASLVSGPNVREIGDRAFRVEFFDFDSYLNAIYHSVSAFSFPKIETIGDEAFYGDTTVSSFVLGSSLTHIGVRAFSVRQGLPVSFDLSALTADDLAGVSIGENAFQCVFYGEPIEEDGTPVLISALVYVKDVETLIEFWQNSKWPLAFRNSATLRSAEDDLDGYDFYSYSAGKYLHFAEGRISFRTETGASEESAMYFIEENGALKAIRRNGNEVSYVDITRDGDIITYQDQLYLRASDLMRGHTLHHAEATVGEEKFDFYFELGISRDLDSGEYESHGVRSVYVTDTDDEAAIEPTEVTYRDGKLIISFVYDGEKIAKGKYTMEVDIGSSTFTATGSMIDQRYAYNVEGTSYNRNSYRILADFANGKIQHILMVENYNYYGLDPWDHFTVLAERENADGSHSVYAEGQRQSGYSVIGVFYTITYDAESGLITLVDKRDSNNMTGMVETEVDTAHEEKAPYYRFTVTVINYTAGDESAQMFYMRASGSVRYFEYDTSRNNYTSSYPEFTLTAADHLTGEFTVQIGEVSYHLTMSYNAETTTWTLSAELVPAE